MHVVDLVEVEHRVRTGVDVHLFGPTLKPRRGVEVLVGGVQVRGKLGDAHLGFGRFGKLRLFFGGRRCDGHLGGIARGSVGVLHVNRIRSMIHVSTILVCQCDARRAIRWCFVSGLRAQMLFDLR